MYKQITLLGLSLLCTNTTTAGEQEELALSYGDANIVSIATGSPQPIKKAPASVSVITAEEIHQLGAKDLDEVLATVPGLHIVNNFSRAGKYLFRGAYSVGNAEALLLINGIPVRNLVNANHFFFWGGMPIHAIARIEVIRGPGSALYGADAFAGVINIWTKDAKTIDGLETGARISSFDTREAWLQYGSTVGAVDLAVSAEWFSTNGHKEVISQDWQSELDQDYGTNVSLAPGSAQNQVDGLELRLDAKYNDWRLRAGLQERRNMGIGVGFTEALDNHAQANHQRINADLTYNKTLQPNTRLEFQVAYYQAKQIFDKDAIIFPPGYKTNGPANIFPDGVISTPETQQHNIQSNLTIHYSGVNNHALLLGIGHENATIDHVEERKNYELIEVDGYLIQHPLGDIHTFTGDQAFIPEKTRTIRHALIQDEWRFAYDWQLITGIRYDHYSDIKKSSIYNPRLALVWDTTFNLTSKLLYGEAFQAPSYNQLYSENNPVSLGNVDLKPQRIKTWELAFNYQASTSLDLDFNVFYNDITDVLSYQPDPSNLINLRAANTGEIKSYGLEVAFYYTGINRLHLEGNYAYQNSEDIINREAVGFAPDHEIFLLADWQATGSINVVNKLRWVGKRQRPAQDSREDLEGYTQWDILVHWRWHNNQYNTTLGVLNVADADIRDPSMETENIPNDIPLAGRSFAATISRRF